MLSKELKTTDVGKILLSKALAQNRKKNNNKKIKKIYKKGQFSSICPKRNKLHAIIKCMCMYVCVKSFTTQILFKMV